MVGFLVHIYIIVNSILGTHILELPLVLVQVLLFGFECICNHISLLVHLDYTFGVYQIRDSGTLPLCILVPLLVWQGSSLLYLLIWCFSIESLSRRGLLLVILHCYYNLVYLHLQLFLFDMVLPWVAYNCRQIKHICTFF